MTGRLTMPKYSQKQISILESTKSFVRDKLESDATGHDWWHIYRVWNNATAIGAKENVDMFVVELAAVLHDIADWKFSGDDKSGGREARKWLEQEGVDEATIAHVCEIIDSLSYKGSGVETKMRSIEGMVVQDADRLDSMGAMGIARTFAYGGSKGRLMHNPDHKPEKHDSFEQYKASSGPSLNHFYEKLLLLQDRLNTETAKTIGAQRHKYMEEFLEQFLAEWDGKA